MKFNRDPSVRHEATDVDIESKKLLRRITKSPLPVMSFRPPNCEARPYSMRRITGNPEIGVHTFHKHCEWASGKLKNWEQGCFSLGNRSSEDRDCSARGLSGGDRDSGHTTVAEKTGRRS
jgi:hypothetical protein